MILSTALLLAATTTATAATTPAAPHVGRYVRDEGLSPAIAAGAASGKMDDEPYSGSYLPRADGELSRKNDPEVGREIRNGWDGCNLIHQAIKDNAKLASSKKFDTAMASAEGRDPGLTADYEKNGYDKKAAYWEGFCHLWSPAGLDPAVSFVISMDRIYANVPFGIGDLKELSTYNYPSPEALFFGRRNYGTKPDSDNLDPADVLTLFQQYVGPGKPGLVLDIDPSAEVWNQPFYSWKTKTKELTGAAAAGAPAGGHVYQVRLDTKYAKESEFAYRGETYLYDLGWTMNFVTDAQGNVVDSSFVTDKSDPIPDFAWVPTGKRTNANLARLETIARDGVAVDDVKAFCEGLQDLTKRNLRYRKAKLADLLGKICPVLDQNKLDRYLDKIAGQKGIDGSALQSAVDFGGPEETAAAPAPAANDG